MHSMDAAGHFRWKKITVMGLGLLGRGVGDARYLAECGAELIVTDLKSREVLAGSVAQLESFSNITFVLGEHRLEDFKNRDMILKAAGVPLDSPYIAEARKNGGNDFEGWGRSSRLSVHRGSEKAGDTGPHER